MQGEFAAQRVTGGGRRIDAGQVCSAASGPEEEEELQAKFAAQRMGPEEEELMQGKIPAQRIPEEAN